jgi:hypothetical protein
MGAAWEQHGLCELALSILPREGFELAIGMFEGHLIV